MTPPADSTPHRGRCQCGALRFEARATPKFVANCHCSSCRRATGAAFSTWVGFRDDEVTWQGTPSTYASSEGVQRGWCSNCGTPMSYRGTKWPGETHFLIGVFEEPAAFRPTGAVFTDEALEWAHASGPTRAD